jgi:hypothetical protein
MSVALEGRHADVVSVNPHLDCAFTSAIVARSVEEVVHVLAAGADIAMGGTDSVVREVRLEMCLQGFCVLKRLLAESVEMCTVVKEAAEDA